MSLDRCNQEKSDVDILQIIIKLILTLVPDRHQRLWNIRNDFTSKRSRPARFPCQLWGYRGRCGALWLCLEGRAEAGQPTGGDLQGCRRHSHTRADDWPTAHLCLCESGYNPALWRRHPSKVTNLPLFSCFYLNINTPQTEDACKTDANFLLSEFWLLLCGYWDREADAPLKWMKL